MRTLVIILGALLLSGCQPAAKKDVQVNQLSSEIRSLKVVVERIEQRLKPEIDQQKVTIHQPSNGSVQVVVQEQLLFDSGSTVVSREGRKLLARFAEGFREAPNSSRIRIVGHSDAMPVGIQLRNKYVDNWELSAARAAAVARSLIWGEDIAPNRLHIEASAHTEPVADNMTAAGRAKNRRIELFVE